MQISYYVLYNDVEHVLPIVDSYKIETEALKRCRELERNDTIERPRLCRVEINDGVRKI